MLKHTPGPWTLLTGEITSATGHYIANVLGGDGARFYEEDINAECLANARLIAAAPNILEALQSAENWLSEYEAGTDSGLHGLLSQCRAAITSATGE